MDGAFTQFHVRFEFRWKRFLWDNFNQLYDEFILIIIIVIQMIILLFQMYIKPFKSPKTVKFDNWIKFRWKLMDQCKFLQYSNNRELFARYRIISRQTARSKSLSLVLLAAFNEARYISHIDQWPDAVIGKLRGKARKTNSWENYSTVLCY